MRPLSAHDLLHVWEWGQDQHPIDRALTLLSMGRPEMSWEELAVLSVGERDACLLMLREYTFGPKLNGFAQCPECAERMEFTVASADLRVASPMPSSSLQEKGKARSGVQSMKLGDYEVRFRLPNSKDLAAIASCQNAEVVRDVLIQRCVLEASHDGKIVTRSEWPPELPTKLAERMAECDPQAEVLLTLTCPACRHSCQILLDIVSFLWTEVCAQAKRLLSEVHTLAHVYGWREADILSMSATRRLLYLQMVT